MASRGPSMPDEPNTSIDPYETLEVDQEATETDIRKAYRKLALKHHPDKVEPSERDAAHKKFQAIAFAYAVLSDPARRRRYDATGSLAESASLDDDDFDWNDFFRAQYEEVTAERVADFERQYKRSEEEKADLLRAYERFSGNMDRVYEEVMLSNPLEDETRFQEILRAAIDAGEIPACDAFTKESDKSRKRRMDKARREAKEAEKHARELKQGKKRNKRPGKNGDVDVDGDASSDEEEGNGNETGDEEDEDEEQDVRKKGAPRRKGSETKTKQKKQSSKASRGGGGGLDDLAALIQQRQQSRANNFLDDLEAKYAPKSSKGKKRVPMDEPPEEAFARTASRKSSKKSRS